jgi:hypothetical protein
MLRWHKGEPMRRGVLRSEMGGYGSRAICGCCGWMSSDGEPLYQTPAKQARNRETVRRAWGVRRLRPEGKV